MATEGGGGGGGDFNIKASFLTSRKSAQVTSYQESYPVARLLTHQRSREDDTAETRKYETALTKITRR